MESNFKHRMDTLWANINQLDHRTRMDMKKMFQTCEKLYDELSKEEVICRARRKSTTKYQKIVQDLEQRLQEIEQYLVIASLIS